MPIESSSPNLSDLRSNLRKVDLNRTPTSSSRLQTSISHHSIEAPPSPSSDRRITVISPAMSTPVRSPTLPADQQSISSSVSYRPAGMARGTGSIHSVASASISHHSNHTRVTSTPSSPRQNTTSATSVASSRTSLLIVVADTNLPSLSTCLQSILRGHGIQEVIISATSDNMAKQLKMDCYTVIGKLSKDIAVQILPSVGPENIDQLIESFRNYGQTALYGVLLCLPTCKSPSTGSQSTDILDISLDDMQSRWRTSILLIQNIARYSIPILGRAPSTPNLDESQNQASSKPFFLVFSDPNSTKSSDPFHKSVQDTLLRTIASSSAAMGFTVGSTDEHVAPLPLTPKLSPRPIDLPRSNGYVPEPEETGQESPTKLYYLWAMQEQT